MLFELFMQGEELGKVSPEQPHLMLWKKIQPDNYVISQQTRWSQMKQDNTLTVTTLEDPEDEELLWESFTDIHLWTLQTLTAIT